MKRECRKYIATNDGRKAIYIDSINYNEIISYVSQDSRHMKKFKTIIDGILQGLRMTELYSKENISKNTKDVTAMKFFKGQENDRIYCKEVSMNDGVFIVIAAVLMEKKKTTKLKAREINEIEKVGGYEYEIK